jgi:hypothetical protein
MEQKIANKTDMIRNTWTFTKGNPGPMSFATAFALMVTDVGNNIVLIDALDIVMSGSSKGITLDTKALKLSMCTFAGKLCNNVGAYAGSINNNTLLARVDFTEDKLMKQVKDLVDDTCEEIKNAAQDSLVAAGAGFGFTAGDITALDTSIGLYRLAINKPRQKIISKKTAKAQIKAIQKHVVEDIFEAQMDKLVRNLEGGPDDDFFQNYFGSREIVDAGKTTGKITGIMQTIGGLPIPGGKLTVYVKDTLTVVGTSTTTAEGRFSVTKLFGDYDCTWEKPGYSKAEEKGVNVGAGKKVQRIITMLPANVPA